MLFGDLKAGEIILVDVSENTDSATFTFKGAPNSELLTTHIDLEAINLAKN
jgi:ATP-dependent Clp protease ATP-binding subunit ClpC